MNRLKSLLIALAALLMIAPAQAVAGTDGDNTSANSRKEERRELVRKSIKEAVNKAKEINADSISERMAQVVSDDFSDTVFVWEDSIDQLDAISDHLDKVGDVSDHAEKAIAVIVILAIFVFPLVSLIAIVWLIVWFSTRKSRDRNRLVAMSIERGIPLPPDYFRQVQRSRLQSGLVWVMWGVGIMVFFLIAVGAKTAAVLGLIPLLVGAAKLITYFVEDRPNKRD